MGRACVHRCRIIPLMSANPIAEIFCNLRRWSGLPKYALERRLDIFLTPYLAGFLSDRLKIPARLVVPEFPIKHGNDNRSVNVDFLLHARDLPGWIFLELKTDARSVGTEQREIYECLQPQSRGEDVMARLLANVRRIAKKSRLWRKYERLLDRVEPLRKPGDRVLLAYLSPRCPERLPAVFFRLRDLAVGLPPQDRSPDRVWRLVSRLLRKLDDGAPRRGERVPWLGEGMDGGYVTRVHGKGIRWTAVDVGYQAGCIIGPGDAGPPMGSVRIGRTDFEAREREFWERQHREALGL